MPAVPSKFATVPVTYGEGKKHLCAEDSMALSFHATEDEARSEVKRDLASGSKMVALFRLEGLYKAKPVEIEEIKDTAAVLESALSNSSKTRSTGSGL